MRATRDCPFCGEPQDAAERFCPKCGNEYPFEDAATEAQPATETPARRARRAATPWYRTVPFLAGVILGVLVLGYILFRVAVSFLDSGRPEPTVPPAPVTTASPSPAAASPVVIAPASPSPSPSPASRGRARVANTDGQGANVRQRPSTTAPVVVSVQDGAIVDLVGLDQPSEGRTWRSIRTEDGQAGWIAAEFLVPE
jgi:hypothetical protein